MTLTPFDVALIRSRVEGLDADGAAEKLAEALSLPADVTDLLASIIAEAQASGYHEGYSDAEAKRPNKVLLWGGVRP